MRRDFVSALVKFVLVASLLLSFGVHHALSGVAPVVDRHGDLAAHHGSDVSQGQCNSRSCEQHQKALDCCVSGKCFTGTLPQPATALMVVAPECVAAGTPTLIPWQRAGPDRPPKGGLFS